MITLLTGLLVLISLALIILVPVALAIPGEWEANSDDFLAVFKVWGILVGIIAFFDGLAATFSITIERF